MYIAHCMTLLLVWGLVTHANAADESLTKACIYAPSPAGTPASTPIQLKPGPQLFLDDFLIASSSNITRKVNVPTRDPAIPNPIVTGKEDGCFQPYLSVVHDAETGRFRIWYGIHTEDFNPARSHIGYMESQDGVHWIRPHRVLADPSPIQFGVSVIDEGRAFPNPTERFKFAWWYGGGIRIATSPDGLVWTPISTDVVIAHNHDITGIHWDSLRQRYVATVSFYITGPTWSGTRRITKQSTSTDLIHWAEPWIVVAPNDKLDQGQTQFYAMDGYLRRGDLIIGMVKVLRDDLKADNPPEPRDAYGIGYTTLAWTRDGEHWTRDCEKFFDRHPQKGEWDHAHAWIDDQLLVGDEVYLYYAGYKCGHKVNRFEERQIGLVKMKRDRYVAREADDKGGTLLTQPLEFKGRALTVNADIQGEMRIRLLGESGRPLRGFDWKNCQPLKGDSLAHRVSWRGSHEKVPDGTVRLEFKMADAKLYGIDVK